MADPATPTSTPFYRSAKPLEIPCILHEVLSYLPFEDLLQARLVSTAWNTEASFVMKSRTKITLNSSKKFIAFNLDNHKAPLPLRYCATFHLVNVHLGTPAVTMFLSKIGPGIKSFQLTDSKWTPSLLRSILRDNLLNLKELTIQGAIPNAHIQVLREKEPSKEERPPLVLKNLRKLDLQLHVSAKGGQGQVAVAQQLLQEEELLTAFTIELVSAAPNLTRLGGGLEVGQNGASRFSVQQKKERYRRILFDLLLRDGGKGSLPALDLSNLNKIAYSLIPFTDIQISQLGRRNFPLQYLNLTILPDISTSALAKLLISLKSSLRRLKLSYTSWRVTDFPRKMGEELDQLNYLYLDWFNGSLDFLLELKGLQTLILAQADVNTMFEEEVAAIEGKSLRNLRTFEAHQPAGPSVSALSVRRICQLFPKVQKLALGKLGDEGLREVWTSFPQLHEFSAVEGAFTDYGVTGLDKVDCRVCGTEHLRQLCRGLYNEELVNLGRREEVGWVGGMKNLTRLTLKSPHITNAAVIHGVQYCKQLVALSLWSYEMNFRSLKRMVDTLPSLESLETSHTFAHIAEIHHALVKMKGKRFVLNGMLAPTSSPPGSRQMREFISEFHDNVCRNIIAQMKQRTSPPYDHDVTVYHNMRHNNMILLMYEAAVATDRQVALQGLMTLGDAI